MSGPVRELAYNESHKLDLYPAERSGQPLVVCVHGGGFISGSRADDRCIQVAARVGSAGFNCASISYSLAPEGDRFACWPRNIFDIADALAFLHDQAGTFRYDFTRLGMVGFSAGCCLSNLYIHGGRRLLDHYGYAAAVHPVYALVGFYGPYDFTTRQKERRSTDPEINRLHSPAYWFRHHPAENPPPVLHIQGDCDEIVHPDQHEAFERDYLARGLSFDSLIMRGFGHSFAPSDGNPESPSLDPGARMMDFLQKKL